MCRDFRCSPIVLTLLSVAVCSPIASLPALSQPRPVASILTLQSGAAEAENVAETAIAPTSERLIACNRAHPVLCIYANRNWVSQLEQELWTPNHTTELKQDVNSNEVLADSPNQTTDAIHLSRKIRFLTRLKTWLDAVS